MTQELEDYYKRLRDNDYKINPFNMKMMNGNKPNKNLPLLLPNGPNQYKTNIKNLKNDKNLDLDEWKANYIQYNTYVIDDSKKRKNAILKNQINSNRQSVNKLRNKINKDVQNNDNVLYKQIKTLEQLKKELTNKKIKYNKLLHSSNASEQLKTDKENLYTETTVRLLLQILGVIIVGGVVYKVSN